jgi:hypothetical protein
MELLKAHSFKLAPDFEPVFLRSCRQAEDIAFLTNTELDTI